MQQLLLALVAIPFASTAQKQQFSTIISGLCRLECENGGNCSYVDNNETVLAHDMQSGKLIEKCTCPPGFGGTGCEIPVEQCQEPTRECHNGAPCTLSASTGAYTCDCVVADAVSKFAGMMCRKPFTEYCNNAGGSVSFCTNGGKCKNSLVVAHLAPGNFTAIQAIRHLGCVCNGAFYGPHCEFLKLPHNTATIDTAFHTVLVDSTNPLLFAKNPLSSTVAANPTLVVTVGNWAPPPEAELEELLNAKAAAAAAIAVGADDSNLDNEDGDDDNETDIPAVLLGASAAGGLVSLLATIWTVRRCRQQLRKRQNLKQERGAAGLTRDGFAENIHPSLEVENGELGSLITAGRNII